MDINQEAWSRRNIVRITGHQFCVRIMNTVSLLLRYSARLLLWREINKWCKYDYSIEKVVILSYCPYLYLTFVHIDNLVVSALQYRIPT